MKGATRRVGHLVIGIIALLLLGLFSPVDAKEPTLARLVFWIPPERLEEFGAAYAEQIAPVLKKHGLAVSSMLGRTTVDSVFSRLFPFETPTAFTSKKEILWRDPAWQDLLQRLGADFRTESDGAIRCQFIHYQSPAGKGRQVPAGSGTRKGEWLTFGTQDGLLDAVALAIIADRDGHLWFSGMQGVTRYDGERFVTFTTDDLIGGFANAMLQDRNGHLWFGTDAGLTRYDGERFVTFTAADGLAGDYATSMLQDRSGNLWFGFNSEAGVTRYDGQTFRTFTSLDGLADGITAPLLEDRDGNLWFSEGFYDYPGRSYETTGITRYDGKTFETLTGPNAPVDHVVYSMLQDRHGHLWFGGMGEVTWSDGKRSETFTTRDGLPEARIVKMVESRDSLLWFVSNLKGISRFDGKARRSDPADPTDLRFTTFTAEDGLPNDQVWDMVEDEDGYLWVGTHGGGVSRYEGTHISSFTPSDGLPSQFVHSILQDSTGAMWFGTFSGLVRYDGEKLITYTTRDGLAEDRANYVVEDLEGNLWIKAAWGHRVTRYDGETFEALTLGDSLDLDRRFQLSPAVDRNGHMWFPAFPLGAVRYDGHSFSMFTEEDGLLSNDVRSLEADQSGNMWFGTAEGVSRYDGETFTSFTRKEGLGLSYVGPIAEDQKGHLWFGSTGKVSRYDGETFTVFTIDDGLKSGAVMSILEDRRGHLWFGIWGGGIVRYDGLVFQDLHHRDGLIADTVHDVYQDRDGDFWIATDSGVTRYRPSTKPPAVRLKEIIADRSYDSVRELALPSSQDLVIFTFGGRSFTTSPDRMVYVYRLQGYEEEWQSTRQTEVRYSDLPVGDYVFEVKAVDRDLNYSDPVAIHLAIHPPYRQWTLVGGLGLALIGLVLTAGYGLRRRRDLRRAEQALMAEMEEELQTAHNLQMGLMPTETPQIEGLDVTGRCLPANHVGGDFFQYFEQNGKLSICMADVTGHAMEAAVPVMMFSGVLESEIKHDQNLGQLFASLNEVLSDKLDSRTYVCFTMGEVDPISKTFRASNGGCPYPYHYRAANGEVSEIQIDAYPLGIRSDTQYPVAEIQLAPGDRVVLCSDGIIEAENSSGEFFGFERTAETIWKGCSRDLTASHLLDYLIDEVKTFTGDIPQGDDQTVVVLAVEA
jgi:ligand-binding sensor domain-containing protein